MGFIAGICIAALSVSFGMAYLMIFEKIQFLGYEIRKVKSK